ncbi:low affinity immunoglobulin gamma Fc region receptor II-b [Labrus bergylta]|uniref:low affinity immunoglobulin gamma Fc region receptor II-b n=1 Tax=Labrus bergylta TaxID=56723 RepID=UPI003314137D
MEITTLCAVVAILRVLPNRSQFFRYESVSLSCEQLGGSTGWTVKRNTSKNTNEGCSKVWDGKNESECFSNDLYPFDSGVYWCESAAGECSDTVNITVYRGSVILESPALPVMEGGDVTLRCTNRNTSSSDSSDFDMTDSSNITAEFYKNGLFIRSSSTGNMTIRGVSKSNEGLYKCNIPGVGQSLDSWLTVRGGRSEEPDSPGACILLPVVLVCLVLIAVIFATLFCLWRRRKEIVDPDVPYTDVTITPGVQPNRITDLDAVPTFYSTVRPGDA